MLALILYLSGNGIALACNGVHGPSNVLRKFNVLLMFMFKHCAVHANRAKVSQRLVTVHENTNHTALPWSAGRRASGLSHSRETPPRGLWRRAVFRRCDWVPSTQPRPARLHTELSLSGRAAPTADDSGRRTRELSPPTLTD